MTQAEWKKKQKEICKKKIRFANKVKADKMIEQVWRTSRWDTSYGLRPTSSYLCPFCKRWHITSKQQRIGN